MRRALADWYDIDRRSDPENAAPHFVLQSLAIARESGETVQNEARESKRLLAVERKAGSSPTTCKPDPVF